MVKDRSTEVASGAGSPGGRPPSDTQWFGHPRGLATLFFTEMWERLSYYGMRALLILFMTAPAIGANAGLAYGEGKAAAIYGLYTSMVYLLALPGGWIADNLWGQRRAVFVGGCLIASGHFSMAAPLVGLPEETFFFLGLLLIVLGTGLLKPNVSTMVGDLYPRPEPGRGEAADQAALARWGARRDAAFSIFYMGINIGAIAGPTICSFLGEKINWHWGFSAAGFGMVFGLIQYKLGGRYLGDVGRLDSTDGGETLRRRSRSFYLTAGVVAAIVAVLVFAVTSGAIATTLQDVATLIGYGILSVTILFFVYLILGNGAALGFLVLGAALYGILLGWWGIQDGGQVATALFLGAFVLAIAMFLAGGGARVTVDKRRLVVIFWLFLLAAVFWSGFEQAGSSMNLYADQLTDRVFFGWEMPTGWLQNVNPTFIVIFAPVFGWLWTSLAARRANPSTPVKFALGLLGLAAGFFVLAWGAANASVAEKAGVSWLVVTYFLHTCGELCLSPVGLSSMTKLAPRGRVGQMMGVWFIAAALGNLFAGLVAGQLEQLPHAVLFRWVAIGITAAGLVALVVSPAIKKLMGRID